MSAGCGLNRVGMLDVAISDDDVDGDSTVIIELTAYYALGIMVNILVVDCMARLAFSAEVSFLLGLGNAYKSNPKY